MTGKLSILEGNWIIWSANKIHEIAPGETVEFEIAGYWIRTKILFGIDGFTASIPGIKLEVGLPVRTIED